MGQCVFMESAAEPNRAMPRRPHQFLITAVLVVAIAMSLLASCSESSGWTDSKVREAGQVLQSILDATITAMDADPGVSAIFRKTGCGTAGVASVGGATTIHTQLPADVAFERVMDAWSELGLMSSDDVVGADDIAAKGGQFGARLSSRGDGKFVLILGTDCRPS